MLNVGDKIRINNESIDITVDGIVYNIDEENGDVFYFYKSRTHRDRYVYNSLYLGQTTLEEFELDTPIDLGVFVTKIDNGEEFETLFDFRVGDVVLTDGMCRYDGQPFKITSYCVLSGNLGYVVENERFGVFSAFKPEIIGICPDDYVPPKTKEYRVCERCHTEFVYENYPEDEHYTLCPACINREYVTPYHRLTPPLKFYCLANRDTERKYFGVELEVELGGEYDSNAAKVVKMMRRNDGSPFVYVSHDSSLNCGFEIITMPATIGYHRRLEPEYAELFHKLIKMGYRGHNSTGAGIHIHVSRNYFGDDDESGVGHLLLLVERFWEEIKIFSRRDYDKSKTYMKDIEEDYDIDEYVEKFNKSDDHDGHHYAVNITNENTIELRMFKSTLNVNSFMCILEFVNSLVEAAKEKSAIEILEMEFDDLLTPRTREYYNSRLELRKYEEV